MKRFFLTLVLSIFFGSLIAQITPEDNQITIKKLDYKIKTINTKNNNLKLENKLFEASLILQEKKIDSLINLLQVSNNKIVNNKNSLGEASQQINHITQESEAFCTKMDNTTLYFAISLVVLLLLIVLELIILNLKRKKEVNRLSEKITELDTELINKIKEAQALLNEKLAETNKELVETNEKLVVEISKNKTQSEKQNEDVKNSLSKNIEELKLLIDEVSQKLDTKLHKNITGVESNIEKLQDAVSVDITNVTKNTDDEFTKIRKEINSLAKKIVPKE